MNSMASTKSAKFVVVPFPDDPEKFQHIVEALKRKTDAIETELNKMRKQKYSSELLQDFEKPSSGQLKRARKFAGLTQDEIARQTKLSQSTISNLETGKGSGKAARFIRAYYEIKWGILFLKGGRILVSEDKIAGGDSH